MKSLNILACFPFLVSSAFSPVASAQDTANPRARPAGERSVPVGREAIPVGAHAVPVGARSVGVGAHAHYTNLNDGRFAALVKAMNNPDTKSLYEGSLEERYAGLQERFISIVKNSPKPSAAAQAAIKTQASHDRTWGDAARSAAGSNSRNLFDQSWWTANKGQFKDARFYYAQTPDADWNKHTGWDALSKELKLASSPLYFDYGRNIVMKEDVIYVNGQKIAGHRDAVGSARRLSGTTIPTKGRQINWLPLGTFLLTQNAEKQKVEIAMQLVCGDEGTIGGTYYNWKTKHTEPILGHLNFDTQRIAFQIKTSRIVMETGLANLTRDEARLWAHLPDGRSPVWLLARVK